MCRTFIAFVTIFLFSAAYAEPKPEDIRQNVDEKAFAALIDQITVEYEAMYFYDMLATHFGHPQVGLLGFSKFFRKMANEEQGHARKITDYVNSRGVSVSALGSIAKLPIEKTNATMAVRSALTKEIAVNDALLSVHKKADKDPNLQDFLESNFLQEQVESIAELRSMLSRLQSALPGMNLEFFVDQELRR